MAKLTSQQAKANKYWEKRSCVQWETADHLIFSYFYLNYRSWDELNHSVNTVLMPCMKSTFRNGFKSHRSNMSLVPQCITLQYFLGALTKLCWSHFPARRNNSFLWKTYTANEQFAVPYLIVVRTLSVANYFKKWRIFTKHFKNSQIIFCKNFWRNDLSRIDETWNKLTGQHKLDWFQFYGKLDDSYSFS